MLTTKPARRLGRMSVEVGHVSISDSGEPKSSLQNSLIPTVDTAIVEHLSRLPPGLGGELVEERKMRKRFVERGCLGSVSVVDAVVSCH